MGCLEVEVGGCWLLVASHDWGTSGYKATLTVEFGFIVEGQKCFLLELFLALLDSESGCRCSQVWYVSWSVLRSCARGLGFGVSHLHKSLHKYSMTLVARVHNSTRKLVAFRGTGIINVGLYSKYLSTCTVFIRFLPPTLHTQVLGMFTKNSTLS